MGFLFPSAVHGRQLVRKGNEVIFNVAKIGKLSSMSIRDNFEICKGDTGDEVYTVAADLMGRTFSFHNEEGKLVAFMAKTKKALLLTAALGSGSESTIDIAKGVDCSLILAAVFGIMQVGSSGTLLCFSSSYLIRCLPRKRLDQRLTEFSLRYAQLSVMLLAITSLIR